MMPGPEEFRRDIRAAKRFGLAQGLLLLPSLFSLILAIAFAVDGSWRETAMAVGVCVLLAGVLVCLECKEKRLRRVDPILHLPPSSGFRLRDSLHRHRDRVGRSMDVPLRRDRPDLPDRGRVFVAGGAAVSTGVLRNCLQGPA